MIYFLILDFINYPFSCLRSGYCNKKRSHSYRNMTKISFNWKADIILSINTSNSSIY